MPLPSNKRRSARLRKKLHIGEFQEMGFEFEATINESFSSEQIELAVDAFLAELVEPRNLGMGGWLNGAYLQKMDGTSATEEDREAVRGWLEARPEVAAVRVSPLFDAHYAQD